MKLMESISFPPMPDNNDQSTDWAYAMRRDMQEIIPGLYLGPYSAAMKSKLGVLISKRITHIVCIRQNIEAHFVRPNFLEHFRYLVLDIADLVTENIIQHFPKVKEFIDDCLQNGGQVLVHGNAGISRSASLVIAYIMEKFGVNYREAFLFVQQRRFCINPNEGFAQQLIEYEPIYKAKLFLPNGYNNMGTCKRKSRDDEEGESMLAPCPKYFPT
ncbi:hypothetical protein LOTGIDRAFT_195282 [Lottia gigantea]|uniref:Tyrosine-protein phosphatase domain-containing protein n=1 Tax=Lottia gigantea TaxID=225164 RepID=V4BB06_LOTGI|nr:hypothetical protein LOTGIDRAFT_195282 [Lottia gigantea]ESO86164.1 hypothetical protein LOTGIDRAFT_195282 [Lottia gigantea]